MSGRIPDSLQGCIPPVIEADRHPDGPWLVVQEPRLEGLPYTVRWLSRASFWNSRSMIADEYDTLDEALEFVGSALCHEAPATMINRRPTRNRDFQRSKVYRWEDQTFRKDRRWVEIPLLECIELVEKVFTEHRRDVPVVHNGAGCSKARGGPRRIVLPRWARTAPVILHECAHGLAPPGSKHGPAFVRVYIDLLEDYAYLDKRKLELSAKAYGLQVDPT